MSLKDQLAIATAQLKGFEIPTLPAEIIELQALFKKTEFPDLSEVANIISRNTVLSGELVKLANQSQFKRKGADDVTTIRGAVDALGAKRLNSIVTSLAFKAQVDDETCESIIDHSVDVANVCAELCGWVDGIEPEEGYMAGLFHNAGAIIMEMRFGDYDPYFQTCLTHCYTGLQKEIKKFGTHHGVFGLLVAKEWCLENVYAQVMIMHHQRNLSVISNEKAKAMVAIVQLALSIVSDVDADKYSTSEIREMQDNAQQELMVDDDVVSEIRLAFMGNTLV